eukprot:1740117-Amphidinium_carterae.2
MSNAWCLVADRNVHTIGCCYLLASGVFFGQCLNCLLSGVESVLMPGRLKPVCCCLVDRDGLRLCRIAGCVHHRKLLPCACGAG